MMWRVIRIGEVLSWPLVIDEDEGLQYLGGFPELNVLFRLLSMTRLGDDVEKGQESSAV